MAQRIARRSRAERTLAWFVPDLALTAAVATLVCLFALFDGASSLFRDSDAGWHIRNGERILASATLPSVDPFSFSKANAPWIAWEWGADVASGLAHQAAGLRGVALMYGLALAVMVWMWFRLNRAAGGNFLLAALFAAPMLSTTNLHWLARPHVFSWLFLLGTVWFCERLPRDLRWWHLAGVAAGAMVWANFHGSFFFAPLIALVYASGAVIRPLVWAGETRGPVRGYLLVAGSAAFGTLINPSGWQLHQHVWNYLTDSALLDRIGEFQSFNFHADGAGQIMLAVALGMLGGFAALAVRRPERFLLAVLLTIAALRMARALPVAALLLLPLANGSLTSALSLMRGLTRQLRQRLDDVLSYGDRLGALDRRFHGLGLVPLIALLTFAGAGHAARFPADQFPVAAAGAVTSLPADARIFAPDKFGGYLIYRFDGARKVFFDGRSDFYGAAFLKTYARIVQARPGWREKFADWHFTHALLPPDYALVAALKADGWTESYRDKTAVLLTGVTY